MSLPIDRTTELACQALATASLAAANIQAQVVTGIDNVDKEAPQVCIYAMVGHEDFPYSGIYHVATTINCKEMAADIDVLTTRLSDTIFRNFLSGSTIPTLNIYPNYFVYNVLVTDTKDMWREDTHEQEYQLDILCALKT